MVNCGQGWERLEVREKSICFIYGGDKNIDKFNKLNNILLIILNMYVSFNILQIKRNVNM